MRFLAPTLVAVMSLLLGCNTASEQAATRFGIPYIDAPITIDGKIEPAEWSTAVAVSPVHVAGRPGEETTAIRIQYDNDFLYVSVQCADSHISDRNNDFWKNDSITVAMNIRREHSDEVSVFGFRVTPQGLVSATRNTWKDGHYPVMREIIDLATPLEEDQFKVASAIGAAEWSMEMALSWSATKMVASDVSDFRIEIARRNINERDVGVAEWPYGRKLRFQFESQGKDGKSVESGQAEPGVGADSR